MAYTFLQLQDEVLNYGFNPNVYRTRVKTWLNEAQRRVARKVELPRDTFYSVPLSLGIATYILPTDLTRVNYVADNTSNNERQLQLFERVEFERLDQVSRGTPTHYFVEGFASSGILLGLWPVPDSTSYNIVVNYRVLPPIMSADSDVPNLGPTSTLETDYDDVLINYALWRAYSSEDDPQMSQFHRGIFENSLRELGTDEQELSDDSGRQIPGMWNL